ncbi:hypothetical protein [Novosphingobium sp. FSW06-99]|uniref:hypothetical protein n=1 Tax=Novosphingobium sp. FSW06-99 TaxID=1739113 RepID=UPI00076BC4D2|nr:hypothetical protein [Novosphingobium sp. FSW06-99]KUR80908.1 hypothetical protein AQZ49_02475 [Novosphingobium sp. FSW06-99]
MIAFEPMRAAHVPMIQLRAGQHGTLGLHEPQMTEEYGWQLIGAGPCWAGIEAHSGRVAGAAGFTVVYPQQAAAWALFSECFADHTRAVVRFVREQIVAGRWARVEAMTRCDRPEQGRFAQACGFHRVAVLRRWGPASIDMVLHEVIDGKLWEKRHASSGC